MDRETETETVRRMEEARGAQLGTGETLDWFDPTMLPWQQYGRALLLFQSVWGLEHVCECACVCGYDCIKPNTGFHVGNSKVHGFMLEP